MDDVLKSKPKLCIICAHIDDEIYGMGGSIKKLAVDHDIHILYICDSVERRDSIERVKEQLGITQTSFLYHTPQSLAPSLIGEIADDIRKFIRMCDPIGVFTHTQYDISTDHQLVHEATMVACRPIDDMCVNIYCFETHGSSNWVSNTRGIFNPNMYIGLDFKEHVTPKLAAISTEYVDQQKSYPHPRSPEAVSIHMKSRGVECQDEYAEAFDTIFRKY